MKEKKDIPSPYIKDAEGQRPLYTLDDMREVWYFAMIHGATLWAYSQEKGRKLPDDFNRGLLGIRQHIKDADTLAYLLGSMPVVMGLYDEILDAIDKVQPSQSVPPKGLKKEASKKTQVKKKSSKE